MSDNVIKFQPRPKPQPPRQTPPWAKRLLVVLAIAAFFIAAYVYFALTGAAAGVGSSSRKQRVATFYASNAKALDRYSAVLASALVWPLWRIDGSPAAAD